MSTFSDLITDIDDGIAGRNAGVPMGFHRLNNHVTIRKSMIYLIGGYTGSGKSALLDDAFILNPIDWYLRDEGKSGIDLEIIYWSMERRKNFKFHKWIARKMFMDNGLVFPVNKIMGWINPAERMTTIDKRMYAGYESYIEALESVVTIKDYPENLTGIRNFVRERALEQGEVVQDGHKKTYIPNKPNKIILNIYDHVGLIRREKNYSIKKQIIDKASEDARYFRDFYGISSIFVSQFNREIANPTRIKNGDVEPILEDFKDSGNTQEDADVVLALFDPIRYKVKDPSGYDLDKLVDSQGRKKYRSLKILKNTYGSDDIRIGLALQPEIGLFKEMPKLKDITDDVYDAILDNNYFLPDYGRF